MQQIFFAGEQVDTDRQCHKGIGGGACSIPRRAGRRLGRLAGERREPALQLTPHSLHQLFRRGYVDAEGRLHPEQELTDGLLIGGQPSGKGGDALHQLGHDQRRQQCQHAEKQRVAGPHRPAAPPAKQFLCKKARRNVEHVGQHQPPAEGCQQRQQTAQRHQGRGQPCHSGKQQRRPRRQHQPIPHRARRAVKIFFHCGSSSFMLHWVYRTIYGKLVVL